MTSSHRRWNMSRIRSKDTKPEIIVRKYLFSRGFRYRLHDRNLPGKPDVVLPRHKTIVFINGCFWHQHKNCKRATQPATNVLYWSAKLNRNVERQNQVIRILRDCGWQVIVVWECEAKHENILQIRFKNLLTLSQKETFDADEYSN